MEWIRVTPDTMPQNTDPVLAPAVGKAGKELLKDAVWDKLKGLWGYEDGADCIIYLDDT